MQTGFRNRRRHFHPESGTDPRGPLQSHGLTRCHLTLRKIGRLFIAMSSHTCPWWLGYLLASPVRRLFENPTARLAPYVREGMLVLEPGPGMGFFTLEMARLVGLGGRVVAVDLQENMVAALRRRAQRAGLADRIDARCCSPDDLGIGDLAGRVDLAVLFHMLHEVSDQSRFLQAIHKALKPGGGVLIVEPRGHVSAEAFQASLAGAKTIGFEIAEPVEGKVLHALLRRTTAGPFS